MDKPKIITTIEQNKILNELDIYFEFIEALTYTWEKNKKLDLELSDEIDVSEHPLSNFIDYSMTWSETPQGSKFWGNYNSTVRNIVESRGLDK